MTFVDIKNDYSLCVCIEEMVKKSTTFLCNLLSKIAANNLLLA